MRLNTIELSKEPLLAKAKAVNYAFYGVFTAHQLCDAGRYPSGNVASWVVDSNGDPGHE
jgi:hypothetical protein